MLLLTFDTTTSRGSVVLTRNEEVLGEINVDSAETHSARLLPSIDFLLSHLHLTLEEMEGYGVVVGPGSFTGVRIGMATAMGLAQALHKRVAAITSLEAAAYKMAGHDGLVASVLDASRRQVYAALFRVRGSEMEQVGADRLLAPEELAQELPPSSLFLVGDGAEQYASLFSRESWIVIHTDPFAGRTAALLALRRFREGQTHPPGEVRAHYVRPSDAETATKGGKGPKV
ncbi:MAG: tRNA (adenosine(37)-N6)-threonylcarbamoyltransferase complex dimerization subunit type 1 TsaB [Acidobacteria bacterium]|nr:tRNA (adenosine(37)-N6)-threonylcarbamoyltransferase complex dimerization subunit type 1 TsaB [Acidobacteriota bacterium]